MGFDGICVSDYGGIGNSHTVQHIGENLAETGMMALEAGMDIEMPSPAGYGQDLYEAFRTGRFSTETLDNVVLRILTEKYRMGLFDHPYAIICSPEKGRIPSFLRRTMDSTAES